MRHHWPVLVTAIAVLAIAGIIAGVYARRSETESNKRATPPATRIVRHTGKARESADKQKASRPEGFSELRALVRDAQRQLLYGIVYGPARAPLPGATVRVQRADLETNGGDSIAATTLLDGSYSLELPQGPGLYRIFVTASGYAPALREVTVEQTSESQSFILSSGHEIAGRVMDHETSLPLPHATVKVMELFPEFLPSLRTDIRGEFVLPPLNATTWTLAAELDGYARSRIFVCPPSSRVIIALVAGEASVEGNTVDSITSTSRQDIPITLSSLLTGEARHTVSNGAFQFRHLSPGEYNIGIPGYEIEPQRVQLEAGEHRRGVVLKVPGELVVTGTVKNAQNGRPISDLDLLYRSSRDSGIITTDAIGRFSFTLPTNLPFQMEVMARGFVPAELDDTGELEQKVSVFPGRAIHHHHVEIRLREAQVLEGQLLGDLDPAATNVYISWNDGGRVHVRRATVNPDGSFYRNGAEETIGKNVRITVVAGSTLTATDALVEKDKGLEVLHFPRMLHMHVNFTHNKEPLSDVDITSAISASAESSAGETFTIQGPTITTDLDGSARLGISPSLPLQLMVQLPNDKVHHVLIEQVPQASRITLGYDAVNKKVHVLTD